MRTRLLSSPLRYPKSVLLIFFGFLALVAGVGYFYAAERGESIRFTERERQGLAYIERVRDLLRDVQQHRGMALLSEGVDGNGRAKLAEKGAIVEQSFFALERINARFGEELEVGDRFERLQGQWAAIKARPVTVAATELFDAHTELAAGLIDLNAHIVDASGLIQEPTLDGYHMVDLVGIQLPSLTERIGQLRALGGYVRAGEADMHEARLNLQLGLERIEQRLRRVEQNLASIFTIRSDLQVQLGPLARAAIGRVQQFSDLIREVLGAEPPQADGLMVFEEGTEAIDSLFAVYGHVAPALDALLEARIERYAAQRITALATIVAIVLVFTYLLTARMRLERLVQQRTQNLQTMNRELESFSYSVSHDLRAPLRAINAFSQILADEETERLSDEGKRYLQRIRAATLKMAALIDGLLELGKVHRGDVVVEPVDLSAIAHAIAADLKAGRPERRVKFVIAPGLTAVGDRQWLWVLVQNLLENAWKFTAHRLDARIEFGAETADGEMQFHVRDNGVGFDPRFSRKLFQPFERLHDEGEFPGTGIGLATVRRVVERHGGRVWAEGEPGEGATFHFTLPVPQAPYRRWRKPRRPRLRGSGRTRSPTDHGARSEGRWESGEKFSRFRGV